MGGEKRKKNQNFPKTKKSKRINKVKNSKTNIFTAKVLNNLFTPFFPFFNKSTVIVYSGK